MLFFRLLGGVFSFITLSVTLGLRVRFFYLLFKTLGLWGIKTAEFHGWRNREDGAGRTIYILGVGSYWNLKKVIFIGYYCLYLYGDFKGSLCVVYERE